MQTWQDIWNKRNLIDVRESDGIEKIVESLLIMDGYDSGTAKLQISAWLDFVTSIAAKANMMKTDSVYEVGCGSGAVLYPLHKRGNKVAGLDFSKKLIEVCQHLFPANEFVSKEARDLDVSPQYDHVIAVGVFLYFPNLDYAADVIKKMYAKAKKGILISDVPNLKTKEECEIRRRGTMPLGEYEKKYAGTSHLYYDENFFSALAKKLGAKKVSIEPQSIGNYFSNQFRFNCFISKI